jgi:hypothetical protein
MTTKPNLSQCHNELYDFLLYHHNHNKHLQRMTNLVYIVLEENCNYFLRLFIICLCMIYQNYT